MIQPTPSPTHHWVRAALAFGAVGLFAGLTHLLVFKVTLPWMPPELANVAGFVTAFWVSFLGHRWASFRDTRMGVAESLWKFALTALAGFVSNEIVFIAVHRLWGATPWVAVLAGMAAAALQTFGLSRFWAFKR